MTFGFQPAIFSRFIENNCFNPPCKENTMSKNTAAKTTGTVAPKAPLRPRCAILEDIAGIGPVAAGAISGNTKTLADGSRKTYYRMQRWVGDRNETVHIPEERVEEFRAASAEKSRLDGLVSELCARDSESLLAGVPVKKKRRR